MYFVNKGGQVLVVFCILFTCDRLSCIVIDTVTKETNYMNIHEGPKSINGTVKLKHVQKYQNMIQLLLVFFHGDL